MLAVVVNSVAVIVGCLIGLVFKRGIPQHLSDCVMTGLALCVTYIGISGALEGQNTIILILSMVLGSLVGGLIDLDGKVVRLGNWIESRFPQREGHKVSVAQGFVTASLLMCVGAMAVVGSLNAGLSQDYEVLFTKSLIDFTSAIMLTVSLGVGVMFASVSLFAWQGFIVLLSGVLQPALTQNGALEEVVCAGSLMILGLGLNMLGVTKIKVVNHLPAIVFAPALCWLVANIPFLAKVFG